MNRTLAVVVALLACGLAVSTGATVLTDGPAQPSAGGADSLSEIDDLIAYPHPGPNGVYAGLEDGEITVEISEHTLENASGVSAGSTTSVEDVFILENVGENATDVRIESDVEEIEYHSEAGPIDEGVTIGANDSIAVGLTVDATDVDAGEEIAGTFSISGTGEGASGSGDGASGSGDGTVADGEWYAASVEVDVTGDGDTRYVEITSDRRQAVVEADLDLEIGAGVTLETIELELSGFADAAFEVETVAGTTELDAMADEVGAEPIGAYAVHDATGDGVGTVEYRFTVEREALEDRGAEAVSLYCHGDGGWEDVRTEIAERTDGDVTYVATHDGFSTCAVGLDAPDLSVTGLEVASSDPVVGEPVATAVTVENDGTAAGTASEPVTVNGERVGVVETTVEPGDAETVTVEWIPEAPGSYEIEAGDVSATVVVEADTSSGDAAATTDGTEATDDGSTDESPSDGDGSADDGTSLAAGTEDDSTPTAVEPIEEQARIASIGGLGLLLLGVAATLGILWIARRRRESDS